MSRKWHAGISNDAFGERGGHESGVTALQAARRGEPQPGQQGLCIQRIRLSVNNRRRERCIDDLQAPVQQARIADNNNPGCKRCIGQRGAEFRADTGWLSRSND